MQAGNLHQLRIKYRKIIEGQDSEQSNEDIRKSISFMKSKTGMRVLTEHCQNLGSSKTKDSTSNSVFIALKERIAQGLKHLSQKQQQISTYKQQITKQKIKILFLQGQLSQNKSEIQQRNAKIIQEKMNFVTLEKETQKLKQLIQDQCIDKQLVFKQNEFYKKEIKDLKNQNKKLKVKLQQQQKEISLIQTLKNNSNRLKQNIKRMQQIISQCCQQKVNIDLTDKYYLGKPIKQANCWFAQNLVGEVESFLRKWQIGHNSRQFIDNLVKFIDQFQKNSKKNYVSSKPKLQKSNNKKRQSKNHNNQLQICGDSQSIHKSLKKSILINKYKRRNKTCTGSLFEDEKDLKATKAIQEYQNALTEALKQNQIKPKKILQLSEELKQYFVNTLEQTKIKIQK